MLVNSARAKLPHPARTLFPGVRLGKAALARYYEAVASLMLPYLADRPVTLKQFPAGIDEPGFFRKHAPPFFPDYLKRAVVPRRDSGKSPVLMATIDEPRDLRYLVGQNAIEFHIPTARLARPHFPDEIVFDLDPHHGDFAGVRKVARLIRDLLSAQSIPLFLKFSGRRGLHLHVPLAGDASYEQLKPWLRRFGDRLASRYPKLLTTEHRREARDAQVYLDLSRNAYAQTVAVPYSVRGYPGAPIAAPLDWKELAKKSPGDLRVDNMLRRIAHKQDPWAGMEQARVSGRWLVDQITE